MIDIDFIKECVNHVNTAPVTSDLIELIEDYESMKREVVSAPKPEPKYWADRFGKLVTNTSKIGYPDTYDCYTEPLYVDPVPEAKLIGFNQSLFAELQCIANSVETADGETIDRQNALSHAASVIRSHADDLLKDGPLVPPPEVTIQDNFNGDDRKLVECATALLELDAKGVLVPNGIGGHARAIIEAFVARSKAMQIHSKSTGEGKWFVFDPEGNQETLYDSRELAEKAKTAVYEEYRQYAADQGWHEDTGRVVWGRVYEELEVYNSGEKIEFEGEMVDCYSARWVSHEPVPEFPMQDDSGDHQKELTKAQIDVLGRPNFACSNIARYLIKKGVYKAPEKLRAESEQAIAIDFLIGFLKKYGDDWSKEADKYLASLNDSQSQSEVKPS